VPNALNGWTYEVIQRLCAAGMSEGDRHDFKGSLADTVPVTKLACAFANTDGGYVVVGVGQKDGRWKIDGVRPNAELYGDFQRKVRAEPAITIPAPKLIPVPQSSNIVYVFEVLRGGRRPYLPVREADRTFWKRMGSSCVQMSREEVRVLMIDEEEKREKLQLLVVELENIRLSIGETASYQPGQYDGTLFSFDIIDRVLVEAYPLLKSDPTTVRVLWTLKKRLMKLNAEKQRLLSMSYYEEGRTFIESAANSFTQLVSQSAGEIDAIIDQVERSLGEKFGTEKLGM